MYDQVSIEKFEITDDDRIYVTCRWPEGFSLNIVVRKNQIVDSNANRLMSKKELTQAIPPAYAVDRQGVLWSEFDFCESGYCMI